MRLNGSEEIGEILTLEQVLSQTGFEVGLANMQEESALVSELSALLPNAVESARQHMMDLRIERGQALGEQLRNDLRELKKWYDAAMQQIVEREANARGAQAMRLHAEKNEVQALYEQRQEWLNDTLRAEPDPYLRIALVFAGS